MIRFWDIKTENAELIGIQLQTFTSIQLDDSIDLNFILAQYFSANNICISLIYVR